MKFRSDSPSQGIQIDITPMVDTIFNLMIFFALSMNFILTPGIKVDLPESSVQEIVQKEKEIVVSITQGGSIIVENKSISITELADKLSKIASKNPEAVMIIQADRSVIHGRVVEIMDVARKKGMRRIAIATQPKIQTD